VVCYCAHLPTLPTRTRVLLLQHPRERNMAIGTARMAHLALPNSVLRVGVDFAADPVVTGAIGGDAPSYLLFPGPGARDVADLPRDQALNLFVVDGTWWQAGKLVKCNPILQRLPRVAFSPSQPSDYRIRRQPAPFCVSTIEALAEVLNRLEPDRGPFDALLQPFRAMIDRQQWYATEVRSQRHHHELRVPRVPAASVRLLADWPRLLFVQGEANAWPSAIRRASRPRSSTGSRTVHPQARPSRRWWRRAARWPRQRRRTPALPPNSWPPAATPPPGTNAGAPSCARRRHRQLGAVLHRSRRQRRVAAGTDRQRHPRGAVADEAPARRHAGRLGGAAGADPARAGVAGRAGRRLSALVALADVVAQPARAAVEPLR